MTFARMESRLVCRPLFAALLAAGGTLAIGCGQATDDALDPGVALLEQVVAPLGKPAAPPTGVAPCQRRALCVPENPCHVGQVTGCKANVPICTDLGAWQPNGASCGEDCVCLRGQPNFCDADAPCFPLDPWGQPDRCQLGVTVCTSGRPVCASQGTAPDGTACADGSPYVCRGGICSWCLDGDWCESGQECIQGVVQSCSTGGTCVAGGPKPNGSWCSSGVCLDGACNVCPWGAGCDTGIPCQPGYVDCSSGSAVCMPSVALDGTPCGVDQFCSGGACTPCGTPCATTDLCTATAALSCVSGLCEPTGSPPGEGASCGPLVGETCVGGVCKGTAGSPVVLRTASGTTMNVTDTSWSACMPNEPLEGMARRAIDRFGDGFFAHADIVFPFSLTCSGPTAQSLGMLARASVYTEGDRFVGWDGPPPSGLPPTVTATATFTYAFDLPGLPPSMKWLFFVDDLATPFALYTGEGKDAPLAPDGYPTTLGTTFRRLRPQCTAGGACQGMGGTCRTWSIACDYYSPACLETGLAPVLASCGGAGEVCIDGACVGPSGGAWFVRTTTGGYQDLTGTTWSICKAGEPDPWTSRRKTSSLFAGGLTASEDVFPSTDCTGAPLQHWQADFTATLGGDRYAGWRGPIPAGVQTTLWTTGLLLSGTGPEGPFVAKDLVLVDVTVTPWRLYTGQDDNPTLLDAEGYPAFMLDGAIYRE